MPVLPLPLGAKAPTEFERRDCSVAHLPVTSWCQACVQARDWPRKSGEEEATLPEIHLDRCFLRKAPGLSASILGWEAASVEDDAVPHGALKKDGTARRRRDIRNFEIAENADTARAKPPGTFAGRFVEICVEVERVQAVTTIVLLERKLGTKVDIHLPNMAWVAEHVTDIYNKTHQYEDGQTAVEKLPLGCHVLHRVTAKNRGRHCCSDAARNVAGKDLVI